MPVRRVMIPKPDGSLRELGIPTVVDRLIQQALPQVLQPLIDPAFSVHSHGFRPGRRAHDAVKAARAFVQYGKRVVVDVDLSKFFDRVNHDGLMDRLFRLLGSGRFYYRNSVGRSCNRPWGLPKDTDLSIYT